MPEETKRFNYRLSKAAKEFNMGKEAIVRFLAKKGFQIDSAPNTKLTTDMYAQLAKAFQDEKEAKNNAKKLGNLSYKGGNVSVESSIEQNEENVSIKKPADEENIGGKEIHYKIKLRDLRFGTNNISIIIGSTEFFLLEAGISPNLNSKKNKSYLNDRSINILLDFSNQTFKFQDPSILSYLRGLSNRLEKKHQKSFERKKEQKEKNKEKAKNKSKTNRKLIPSSQGKAEKESVLSIVTHSVLLSEIEFDQGVACLVYKNRPYVCSDYDKVLEQIQKRLSNSSNNSDNAPLLIVEIDMKKRTFAFSDVWRRKKSEKVSDPNNDPVHSNNTTETYYEIVSQSINVPQKSSSALKTMMLGAGNIRFFNGNYLIFRTNNGEIDDSVAPCRVNDSDSTETLNLVHKYFEQKLEQSRIFIKYDATKVHEPSRLDLFQLSNYIKTLKRNLDIEGEWWKEVQNERKTTFAKCRSIAPQIVKKKVSLKNGYLDNLSGMQSEKKLISVYEVNNHGKEEDAFIFTINMSNDRCAIIFENASNEASTTTWVFIAKMENYESCINLVFDYFTDYTLSSKRYTLRAKTINPPEKFKAEDYTFIDHDNLGQWLKKLNKILEQTSEPSEIQFVPGIHIPESSDTRAGHGETISTRHLHNQLMSKLYDKLSSESGKDNVGTEIQVGTKRIDAVVKGDDFYDIYEIKTADNPFECVTEALGQLCQYTYLFCRDKIGKMVIVGPSEMTKEVKEYLSWFLKNYSLQLYYMKV